MSDAFVPSVDTGDAAPAVDTAPVVDTAPTTTDTAAPEPGSDGWLSTLPPDAATEIRRLRDEAGGYRTERNTYKDAFEGYSDEERDFLLGFARDLRNPESAPTAVERMAEALGLTPAQAAAAQQQADADPGFDPFDPNSISELVNAQVQQVLSQRDEQTQRQAGIDAVFKQVSDLGMDPQGPDGLFLQTLALTQFGGDITAAHKAVEDMRAADKQRYIDDYVAGKAGNADASVDPTPQTGGATTATEDPKDWGEARTRARARLDALYQS